MTCGIGDRSNFRQGLPRQRRHYRQGYPIGAFVLYYFIAWAAVIMGVLAHPLIGIFMYFAAGYWLNRKVLAEVEWHRYTTTLSSLAMVKVRSLMLWPLEYAHFLVQLFICRYL